jgi:hypothetical protein
MYVINLSRAKGFFRAKEASWWEIDKTTHRFNPAHPNLIKQSQDYARRLETILEAHAKSHPEITPILLFSNPGVNIETSNPAIRIVRMDGVESLIASLLKSKEILQLNQITFLSDPLG